MDIENKILNFYRNLDPNNHAIFEHLNSYTESFREQAKNLNFNQDQISKLYGLLAEETAYYLLRMYQSAGFPIEILHTYLFEYSKGKTTEVDLIALTPNNIYVVECKHRSSNLSINADGSFNTRGKTESPVDQNIMHLQLMLKKSGYSNIVPKSKIYNIVYLTLNNCKVTNPITTFEKDGYRGAFTGRSNFLSLIHKLEQEATGRPLPYKRIAGSLRSKRLDSSKMKDHIEFIKRKHGGK